MPCLVFKDKEKRRIEVTIDRPEIRVGREEGNDVVIPFRSVSRNHCAFQNRGDGVYLRDLGSSNGTRVNGETLMGERKLVDRDRVKIGEFRIRFYETSKYPQKSLSIDKTQSVVLFQRDRNLELLAERVKRRRRFPIALGLIGIALFGAGAIVVLVLVLIRLGILQVAR